ncbi:MAG: FkbM family methyltransferase [Gemmatimonadaceae bacterium]
MPRNDIAINLASRSGPKTVTLSLDPSQMSQQIMLGDFGRGQLYEAETSNFLGNILMPGDTFIDIGAHVGYFSMLASALVGDTGRVYSFEPERENYDHLVQHIGLNNASNITPVHMAVGAVPAVADFFVNADNDGGHALWEVGRHPFNERSRQAPTTRKVAVTSLDHFFAKTDLSPLKAIKIDAEGAEFAILVGARNLLARVPVPFIVAECNRFGLESMGASERHLRSVVGELGYETYLFQPGQAWLQRLGPDETPDTNFVFNLLFRHPLAPALAA